MLQVKLEEQEEKSNTLGEVNSVLRDQLDKAAENNTNLVGDLKRLAGDWEKLNRELITRVRSNCYSFRQVRYLVEVTILTECWYY